MLVPTLAVSAGVSKGHPILGTWRMDGRCAETYEFKSDGTRTGTDAAEALQSEFEISSVPSAKGFYVLKDTVVKTNAKPDCRGRLTSVGDVRKLYIRFVEASGFLLCFSESQADCVGPFERIHARSP
jgi:hypothetical protein